jgi:site-specific recombinase XerD
MRMHHLLEQILDEYLFPQASRAGNPYSRALINQLGTAVTGRALNRDNTWAVIRQRAKAAGFLTPVGCHIWRQTGITIYLENDGRLEHAQQMAGHEYPHTTKLYDRTKGELTLSEVERIRL